MRLISLMLIAGLAGAACSAAPRVPLEPTPKWRTTDGRRSLWKSMADWYIENDQPDQALQMIARLRQEGVSGAEIDLLQGRALLAADIPEEAKLVLERAAASYPNDARPLQSLGIIYSDLGEVDLAMATLQRALELDPEHTATRNNLGFLLLSAGDCAGAVEELEVVMSQDATTRRYRNNLAFGLVCAGQPKRALELFRSTAENEADARFNMGLAYERLDRESSAALQYQQALRSNPSHEDAAAALARLEHLIPDDETAAGGVP